MTAPLLITGGTGLLGRQTLPLLRDTEVRVLSRGDRESPPGVDYVTGDLATGAGIEAAVAGAHTVLHLAGSAKGDDRKTETLVRAAARARVRHIVFISVVGAGCAPTGYYGAKGGAEQAIARSGLPWTTLRATQFHDALLKVLTGMARLPVIPVPTGLRFQPVDTAEVAHRLVELVRGEPAGLVPDLAGPRVYEMRELVRGYLDAANRRRPILPVRLAGRTYRAMRAGANLSPDRAVGVRTWEAFLADQTGRPLTPTLG